MLPVYVVSLVKDAEKRKTIRDKLDSLYIPFEFVNAVYGKELDKETFERLKPDGRSLDTGDWPTLGEVGCTLSHLKTYQLMQQRQQEWACIFEDDAIIDDRFKEFWNSYEASQSLFDTCNIYLLGGQNGVSSYPLVSKSFFSCFYVGKQKFAKIINSEKYISRTCCYLVSSNVAQKLIDLSKVTYLLADDWEFMVRNKLINDVYLADFVDHPTDLSLSNIELERREVEIKVRSKLIKKNYFRRQLKACVMYIKFHVRLCLTQLYRFKR